MKTIKLYGHLAKEFGKTHHYNVRTPAEAIKALSANHPNFQQYLIKHSEPGYKVIVGDSVRSSHESMYHPLDSDTIKIVPVVHGAGDGTLTVILGIVLIAFAWWNPYGWGMAAGATSGAGATAATGTMGAAFGASVVSAMSSVGIALVLAGVSSMLFAPPSLESANTVEQNAGSYFNGPLNTAQQGNPVSLAYGRIMAGSQVISGGIETIYVGVTPAVQDDLTGKVTKSASYNYIALDIAVVDVDSTWVDFYITSGPSLATLYTSKDPVTVAPLNAAIRSTTKKQFKTDNGKVEAFYIPLFIKLNTDSGFADRTFTYYAKDELNNISEIQTVTIKFAVATYVTSGA